ncbi:type II secretion system F family protein [Salinibius halmophilus]|uniref:type II secretion system F family protein n=1 Tax=Salinibius halmophilus TaxID=1853216 RepID=UPI000E661EED|nr:type II secretion system F family protein [Salinibius halmophilus]
MSFLYKGRDADGQLHEGQLDVESQEQAISALRKDGIIPISLEKKKPKTKLALPVRQQVTLDELILFSRQMYALAKSGLPIVSAIRGLADGHDNAYMKQTLLNVGQSLQQGNSLSSCLADHPKVFGRLYIGMIRVGESTGKLDEAFQQLVQHLELEKRTKKQVQQAVRYPSFVMISILAAVFIVSLFVIPRFKALFDQFDAGLPLATRILIGFSDFMLSYWWMLLLILVAAVVAARQYFATDTGRLWRDRNIIRLPIIGKILYRINMTRFARPFAMMLDAGIPILQAISIAARSSSNAHISRYLIGMREDIERGDNLINAAANTNLFSNLMLQMIAVGEQSGQIGEQLRQIADFYDQEVDYQLKNLSQSIEPILVIVMAVLVLILALGVFLPLWDLSSAAT